MTYRLMFICLLLFAMAGFNVSLVYAGDSEQQQIVDTSIDQSRASCAVRIRVIRGEKSGSPLASIDGGPMLDDVRAQLKVLPFAHYQVIDTVEDEMQIGQSRTFSVRESEGVANAVQIEPHQLTDGRIWVSVNWRGPQGEELLFTKLKFENGKSMVVGTDRSHSSSIILCLRFECR